MYVPVHVYLGQGGSPSSVCSKAFVIGHILATKATDNAGLIMKFKHPVCQTYM